MASLMKIVVIVIGLPYFYRVHGQILTVNLQSDESYSWNPSTLSCSYTVSGARYNFWNLQWYKGITISDPLAISIADFFGGISSPRLFNGYDDTSKYTLSRDSASSISTLHILSVNFTKDSGRYWCRVTVIDPGVSQEQDSDSTELVIFVLPTSITLSDSDGPFPPTGGKSYLVDGVIHEYTCRVPDIDPGASFAWSVGGGGLTLGTTTDTTGSYGLITSTGTAILSPTWSNHGQVLQCQASNKNGHAGVNVEVVLDVKVPPRVSRMSLHDSRGSRLDVSVDIDEGKQETFTCKAQSRPAAKMEWFLDDTSQGVIDAPIGVGDGLINTTSSWSLTAVRGNHGQRVKCEASTAESDINALPYVTVTVNVNGPPDNVFISGMTLMTEDVASTLTCTAANAYPEHWSLVWSNVSSNGDINIPGATSDPPLSTNGRYTFTSRLDLTPSRHDNGNSIRCAARWNSWTPEPLDTFGPLNVQHEAIITNKGMTEEVVKDGGSASLTCIAEGNPKPTMQWYDLNNTVVTNETDTAKFVLVNVITGGEGVYGLQVTSTLTINDIDSGLDFGMYTCISTNGIGEEDMLKVNLTGTRRPDKPSSVMITGQTAQSLTVAWTAGYDGGEEQSFRVAYLKTSDSTETRAGNNVTGGKTTYLVTGLEDYTKYEIRVYAKNIIGENTDYAKVVGHTLPKSPSPNLGITVEYNTDDGTVKVTGLRIENSCIQLEVKYEGSDTRQECGKCIASNRTVTLSEWCAASQKRRRRAVGDIEDVRAKLCIGGLCSEAAPAKQVKDPIPELNRPAGSTGIIVGVVVAVVVLTLVILLGVHAKRRFKFRNHSKQDNETQCTAKSLSLKPTSSKSPRYADTDAQSPYQEITELAAIKQPAYQDQVVATYSNVTMERKAFPRDQLKIIKELGQGAFGLVLLAQATGITERSKVTLVAVKTLKDGASKTDKDGLMKELDLMKKLPDHCNVVRLLGFCINDVHPQGPSCP
ncbi:nephrin-like isoform X2 [Acanthaster planci]|uniref:Nephrin-like isoform X2 n=1 Tax=Acanthaster planci TaxID=133434 RepID=A0A8B7ZYH2_ACAPL|nr:nephrin-like isoform X2 [Acanthaster planci]